MLMLSVNTTMSITNFNMILMALVIVMPVISANSGSVTILRSVHPYYVKYGGNLELTCTSKDRAKLKWKTPPSSWRDFIHVTAPLDPDWVVRTCMEEPSGVVTSTLTKKNVNWNDSGRYQCQDSRHNFFFVNVSVVEIMTSVKQTDVYGRPSVLSCAIMGSQPHPSPMSVQWYFKGTDITSNTDKYTVASYGGRTTITIKNTGYTGHGAYQCAFTLNTTLGPVTFSEDVFVDAANLRVTSGALCVQSSTPFSCMAVCMLAVLYLSLHAGSWT